MEQKEIRFIDSRYNELFRIKDGENITITHSDGTKKDHKCTYIDPTHTQIGSHTFHICEFAERMERGGSIYRPKNTPSYILEQIDQSEFEYMFRPNDENQNRGCICYIRGYFDSSIDEQLQTTSMIESRENYKKLRTEKFSLECDNVINYFRFQSDTPILKSRIKMSNAAYDTQAQRLASDNEVSGYRLTTDENVYYFRCCPRRGDYNVYIYCYNKEMLNKHKDLQFVERNFERLNTDKFHIGTNSVTQTYYNPDADAGGQLVELTISYDDIKDAAAKYKNPKDFFSYLEAVSKGSLYDVGTETFRENAQAFIDGKADFEGCNRDTMKQLKKAAGIEPTKSRKHENFER